jgi:selenocysteine lyase/cysteine desulfurase
VEVPLTKWDNREFLRISIQAYNSAEDVDRLVEALGRESRRS